MWDLHVYSITYTRLAIQFGMANIPSEALWHTSTSSLSNKDLIQQIEVMHAHV